MVKRTVVWTNTAVIQRREILKYWIERNGTTLYAEKLIKLIAEQISVIHKNPYSFKSVNYPDTHVSVLGHFSVFYKITKTNIIITAFWDNRQNPKKLLRLLRKKSNE
ncbi:MAG: type II toxin-antitoxin system RelE/ParE family toxin [Crocinitomicaceae bacterium]|nr:type II toxin-antitoxin system RelE/ParE family toxin [Crocinitomicaceae bacterium]